MADLLNLDFSLHSKQCLVLLNKNRLPSLSPYEGLKVKQLMCLRSIFERKDLIVCLPTGYGKSLIYDILPYVTSSSECSAIIVITPLNAIINEVLSRHGELAMKVCSECLVSGTGENKMFKACKFRYVVGHPELLLEKGFIDIMKTWPSRVNWIVVDEAHCVSKWGCEFRPAFQRLGNLRAIFPSAGVIAMTATATERIRKDLIIYLSLNDPDCVTSSIDRVNIKLCLRKRKPHAGGENTSESSVIDVLSSIAEELVMEKLNFPKTIIYSKLNWCGFGYEYVLRCLLKKSKRTGQPLNRSLVSQFHAPCTEDTNAATASSFAMGDIRLLFATDAYGMGTDVHDIRRIMHIGPPMSLETYVQQIGRGGRDGAMSSATLFCNASDIGQNVSAMDEEMRNYCRSQNCLRQFIADYFMYELDFSQSKHMCCSICETKCVCKNCKK